MGGGDFVHVYKNEQGGFCPGGGGGDYVRNHKKPCPSNKAQISKIT